MGDENIYPSINSESADERILARRQRIVKTLEERHKGFLPKDQQSEKNKEFLKSETRITQSNQSLSRLISGSSELVSNVEIACQGRLIALREEENLRRNQRLVKLENEPKAAAEKFYNIVNKWDVLLKNEDSQSLHKILLSQQKSCYELIEGKNVLIRELEHDLKQKDNQFIQDLLNQAKDVDLILERMEEQIKTLKKAYRDELDNIEDAFYCERNDLLCTQKNKWQQKLNLCHSKEVEYMELKEKRVEEVQMQMEMLRVQDAEDYNILKAKLENEVQILEENLQQMKETCQLNQEKLEYNFQVLKKRDEENMITKSQQKRKITRLQDYLNNLNQKLKKQEKQSSDENLSFECDLARVIEQYKELQKKFCHFQITDNKKFEDIWIMNENLTMDLIEDVLKIDQIITEQQLGLDWHAPNLKFLIASPFKKERDVLFTADQEVSSIKSNLEEISSVGNLKNMLNILCDESGFLVESKLSKLLAPINKNDQSLMTLDAVFNALSIKSVSDMELLSQHFFKTQNLENFIEMKNGIKSENENSPQMIHPNMVVKVLRSFLEENIIGYERTRMNSHKNKSITHANSSEYWKQLESVIDSKKNHLWDGLTEGFELYNKVLNERALLIQDNELLHKQNGELKILLHQYLSSKVMEIKMSWHILRPLDKKRRTSNF
ncbi:dynein regulatory complex protein 1 isoform X7 [Hydra vulgaris]|uniref:Dynein regulatory complex protein 1 isoform X6 n=1 Tax=Hydra vulgaris TaxID=6087 RepID=A0ABM4BSC8_HYDVU